MKKIVCLLFFFYSFNAHSSKCETTISKAKQGKVRSKGKSPKAKQGEVQSKRKSATVLDSREKRPGDDELPTSSEMLDPKRYRNVKVSRRVAVLDEEGNVVSVSEPLSFMERIVKKFKRDKQRDVVSVPKAKQGKVRSKGKSPKAKQGEVQSKRKSATVLDSREKRPGDDRLPSSSEMLDPRRYRGWSRN